MENETVSRQEPRLNLDINAQRSFIKFHAKLEEKPKTTVRFFDRTECYTVHGPDDCELVAKLVYKSSAYIHYLLPDEKSSLAYVTLSKINFEKAVRELLLVRNLRAEIYVRSPNSNDWHLEYRGSPGNLLQFEDILFTNKEDLVGNNILSLQLKVVGGQRKLGVVAVDQNDCCFQLVEFLDDDFYTELEATIVLLGPRECLLPSVEGEYAPIKALLERSSIMITTIKKKSSATENSDLVQDLNRLLRFAKGQQEDVQVLPEIKMVLAMGAVQMAIKYLKLTDDSANYGHYQMKQLDLKRYVHLDSAAVMALNILPKPGTTPSMPGYRWQSVLGVLDHCRTPQGHRLLAQWIKQPLRNIDILNDRHNIVECLLEAPTALNTLSDDYLKRIPDILMLTKKLMRRKASLQDLFRIYQVMLRTPKIVNALRELENATIKNVLCDPMISLLEDLSGLKRMVDQVLDFEAIESGEYLVKPSFDSKLQEFKERMSHLHSKMERLKEQATADLFLDRGQQVRLENVSHLGYIFRITLKDDAALRKNKKYTIIDVIKGGVRFSNDQLKEYSEDCIELRAKYEEQQLSIVDEIIKVALGYAAPLTSLNNELAQLDCLVSFAIAAQMAPTRYVRPKMLAEGSGILKLKNVRHPCLELQENVEFIANDVDFEKDVCNMFIITGPNMGGKSTYIRSIGTTVLMAHIGSFVPTDEATVSMVDSILGRVGASDNIIKGLSTFMVEMIETSGIIRTATDKSLVIIDELGRGTSTYEGCGIAWSIAEHLAKETNCFTLFATHFHEITKLAESVTTVKNYHMAAVTDDKTFTLLYQVRPGVTEKSFGIQIARLASFPENVVQDAEKYYKEFEDPHADKQTENDKALIAKVNTAIDELTGTGNNVDISVQDLTDLVERFTRDIRQLDSEYFHELKNTSNSS